jgi:hypothetical protein
LIPGCCSPGLQGGNVQHRTSKVVPLIQQNKSPARSNGIASGLLDSSAWLERFAVIRPASPSLVVFLVIFKFQ